MLSNYEEIFRNLGKIFIQINWKIWKNSLKIRHYKNRYLEVLLKKKFEELFNGD